ncbi:MAG: Transcriptional regulator, GntR family [Bradyrhizobium sp.]|nr:Transcriptional regulator, GntR family [Bradyrhizobium sp.]
MAEPDKDEEDAGSVSVVRFAPIHDQILPHLRRDIVENRWKSGERLSEPLLCKQFGVSRTPLRVALKTLEAEGLIRLVPHVGAVVTDPGTSEIAETMEILIGLEQLAAIRVAQSKRPEVLQDIRRIYEEMRRAARRGDASRYFELNNDFHLCIVRGTRNRSLVDLHEKVMWHVHRERHRANVIESVTVESAESHHGIVEAILKHRAEDAGRAMRKHLEDVSKLMLVNRVAQQAEAPTKSAGTKPKTKARAGRNGTA